jgi:large subunit ribosomal protein L25
MKSYLLNAFPRTLVRRKGSRAVRSGGRIPAVIYGKSIAPQNLEVDQKAFEVLVQTAHTEVILVDLHLEGEGQAGRMAIIQGVQHHPLSGKTLHVDFHEVRADERVTIQVPVESTGEAVGVKVGGGVLEHVLFKVKVRALPKDLPEQITVDVSHLEAGKTIHIGEIPAPAGVEILGNKDVPVFAISAPVVSPEPVADAGKQPEMIKEKKDAKKKK